MFRVQIPTEALAVEWNGIPRKAHTLEITSPTLVTATISMKLIMVCLINGEIHLSLLSTKHTKKQRLYGINKRRYARGVR